MPTRDFEAEIEENGVKTKQVLRFANFEGDEEAAKREFYKLHKVPSPNKKILSIKALAEQPNPNTVEDVLTPPRTVTRQP